jgi:cytoskeletal protein CcmA (bactofilin family)
MFHRVKSEIQDADQNTEKEDKSTFRQEDQRPPVGRYERVVEQPSKEDNNSPSPRVYGRNPMSAPQQEEREMAKQDTSTQDKFEAEKAEEQNEEVRPSYQPSVAPRSGSNYGSSSYSAPAYSAPESYASTGSDRTLTIGRGINMSGEIESCDHLMVEGTVEAALKGAKLLEIAESGTFYGTVEIEEATIAGRFEGDITVNGRLTLKSSGVITGSIAYRELEVEAGAVLDGRMTPLKGVVDPKSADDYRKGSEASAMAKAKASTAKKDSREPANTEQGLFSRARG